MRATVTLAIGIAIGMAAGIGVGHYSARSPAINVEEQASAQGRSIESLRLEAERNQLKKLLAQFTPGSPLVQDQEQRVRDLENRVTEKLARFRDGGQNAEHASSGSR